MKKNLKKERERMPIHGEQFVIAADDILPAYLSNYKLRIGTAGVPCHNPRKRSVPATIQSEQSTRCDINVEQWETAIHSALRDLTADKYPHHSVIKCLLNYILNGNTYTDFGLVREVLSRLLSLHPASDSYMLKYYRHILCDHYALINGEKEEDQPFLWAVVEMVTSLPKEQYSPVLYQSHPPPATNFDIEHLETLNTRKKKGKSDRKTTRFYNDLDPSEQRKRSIFCLEFLCDVLEQDLIAWLEQFDASNHSGRSLISRLIWSNSNQQCHITPCLQKIIALQDNGLVRRDGTSDVCERLITMAAEVVRLGDRSCKATYPYFGTFSTDLARELGLRLLGRFQENKDVDVVGYLNRLRPAWLRLLTTCRLLGDLAGFYCLPEMLSAVTVMEHLEQTFKLGRQQMRMKKKVETAPADPVLVSKFEKLKSVNTLFRSGLSRLHAACHDNNVGAVRALLTFPTLDLNLKNPSGWTALHVAAARGSDACVKELLTFAPQVGDVQRRVDTRAAGPSSYTPLMRAVECTNAGVCRLLLQHTGSVLLEDITDDNETALDLCKDNEVREILNHYTKVKVETIFSKREMSLSTGNLPLAATLCCLLTESYFAVHRTWDVYHSVKKLSGQCHDTKRARPRILSEYSRYYRDIKTNLMKTRQMVMKLRKVPQLACTMDIFQCIVSLNKI